MSSSLAATDFLELLKSSELLSEEQFGAAVQKLELDKVGTAEEAASRIVRSRLITPFQAERLLAGRSRGFFIDRYKILEILGVGGMGCIYVAEDIQSRQRVALKVLTTRHEVDSGMLARFRLEAKAGLRLNHPNVCRTLESGDTGAISFFAMEFVKGVSLHELIVLSGPIPWKQCCDFFMQAAAGLHHAHQRGLVHRDVKPANLLVDPEGQVKVVDFGLALLADSPDEEFSLQMIFGHDCLGTADFIAPEQSLNSSSVDCRADVYGLGCTMYVALTGTFPFPYPHTAQKLEAHRTKRARPIRELNPDVPESVQHVVEQMMRKRPEQRYQSCAEVAAALKPLAVRAPVKFDFQKILSMRIKENKLREQALRIGQSTMAGRGPNSRPAASSRSQLPAGIETVVGEDTVTSRPRSSVTNSAQGNAAQAAAALTAGRRVSSLVDNAAARRILVNQSSGLQIPLVGDVVSIGRGPECTIAVDDPSISTRHCELRNEGNEWRIIDLGSKNGILVNGKRVTARNLVPGDRITVGKSARFQYRPRSDQTRSNSSSRVWWILAGILVLSGGAAAAWWLLQ